MTTPIEALRDAIVRRDPRSSLFDKPAFGAYGRLEYAIWRFLRCWSESGCFGPDEAVLLRQVVRWAEGRTLFVGTESRDLVARWQLAGVHVDDVGRLCGAPFVPDWARDDCIDAATGMDHAPIERRCLPGGAPEPFLERFGYDAWRSPAQKEAVWEALMAPPGSTTLIVLPTGMGKSLSFQLAAAARRGVTVVVVPTVALAIAQWQSARGLMARIGAADVSPLYYAAEDPDMDPDTVLRALRSGGSRLVFTSPEACVSGKLRGALEEMAADGLLAHLVLDEAHLVETWGAYFRIDFQVLAGLQRKWRQATGGSLRTLLLSATITPACKDALRRLFARGCEWHEFLYQQLRPEMVYYDRQFADEGERDRAVWDCIWRLPRPAILYVTEPPVAQEWERRLRREGFKRVGCFHGDTPAGERRRLLEEWRNDSIDLMTATSAFGVGVDKQDVRAVIHACFPEDMNRYYQEVGRGGRDGNSSVSVLLPIEREYHSARGHMRRLLGEDLVQERWEAMWTLRETLEEQGAARICLNTKREGLIGTRTWEENVRWNKRLVMQLQRANLLELQDMEYRRTAEDEEPEEWAVVKLKFAGFGRVGEALGPQRRAELAEADDNLDHLRQYLKGQRCVGRILRDLYGGESQHVCCGCRSCRLHGYPRLSVPGPDWELTGGLSRFSFVLNGPTLTARTGEEFAQLLRRCIEERGLRRFAALTSIRDRLHPILSRLFPYRLELFRFDDLDLEPPFLVRPDESVVVFHFDRVLTSALRRPYGAVVHHVFGPGITLAEARYSLPAGTSPMRVYENADQWLQGRE